MTQRSTRPRVLGSRETLAILTVLLACKSTPAQVTGKQGEPDSVEFHDSMVLEVPFPPARPELTDKLRAWYTDGTDANQLRKYQCDRIRVFLVQCRVKSRSGKETVDVEMRVLLQNPDGNHDKQVNLTVEVHNGDTVIATVKRLIKVEENRTETAEFELRVPVSGLIATPVTQLRITLHTKNI
jgi:hypothetical protein